MIPLVAFYAGVLLTVTVVAFAFIAAVVWPLKGASLPANDADPSKPVDHNHV